MKAWTKLLPFFVVEWLAKREMERWTIDLAGKRAIVVVPYRGTFMLIEELKDNG
jgi:hypothetical protein